MFEVMYEFGGRRSEGMRSHCLVSQTIPFRDLLPSDAGQYPTTSYCLYTDKLQTPRQFSPSSSDLLSPSMTTVERYRPPQLDLHSDAPSSPRRPHSSSNSIARSIPPAVPSPPRLYTTTSPPRKPHIITEPSPTFKMAAEESSQWLFTEEEVLSAP